MRFTHVLVPVLGLSALVGGGFLLAQQDGNPPQEQLFFQDRKPQQGGDLAAVQQQWEERIDEAGTEQAYEEFKEAYASSHFSTQHLNAHLMGELLYRKLGMKGVAVCDATFAFGCYHSLFGQALAEHGMAAVVQLDQACVEKYGEYGTGCQHGIGHGLLEYLGHKQFVKALEGCKFTTQVQKLFGCTSGVFMEYNVPILITPGKAETKVRTLNPDNPYEPCNTIVSQEFRESCYYEIGQWWDKVYEGDYAKIGEMCSKVAADKEREACFLGTGNVGAPASEYDVALTIAKCKLMPTPQGQLLCRAGASWSFFSVPERREFSPLLCQGFEQDKAHRCVLQSDLIGTGEITK